MNITGQHILEGFIDNSAEQGDLNAVVELTRGVWKLGELANAWGMPPNQMLTVIGDHCAHIDGFTPEQVYDLYHALGGESDHFDDFMCEYERAPDLGVSQRDWV